MIPRVIKDDTLDPAYFARKPRRQDGGGGDYSELLERIIHLEECCTEVQPELETLRRAIEILNGDDDVDGSVIQTVENEVEKLIDGAPETFDTFYEVAEWIEDNSTTINYIAEIVEGLDKMKPISNIEIDNLF